MSRNIALAGMMGAGKTTVGRLLATRLGRGFVDTDEEIVRHVGRSIPEIFATHGEPRFRELEHEVVRALAGVDDLVVGLGGGVVLSDANVAELLLSGTIVLLDVDVATVVERLASDTTRPLLAGGDLHEQVSATLAARVDRYAEVADLRVDARRGPEPIVEEIVAWLKERGDVLTPSELEQTL